MDLITELRARGARIRSASGWNLVVGSIGSLRLRVLLASPVRVYMLFFARPSSGVSVDVVFDVCV